MDTVSVRWWNGDVRGPQEMLGGVKMLAREIDKVRAGLAGSPIGQLDANEALLDAAFFALLDISRDALAAIVRQAWADCQDGNREALTDLRESVESEPEISDARFMTQAQASDIDNAALGWLFGTLRTSPDAVAAVNREVERIALQ
jgi:hypothetical protein